MKRILSVALFLGFFTGAVAQSAKSPLDVIKRGIASFYHPKFEGRRTATGEVFANKAYTAASNRLRLNTYVKVTNLSNAHVVYVKINDRMAASSTRMLDLTEAAADQLGYRSAGTAQVKMEVVSEEEGRYGVLAQRDAISVGRKNTL